MDVSKYGLNVLPEMAIAANTVETDQEGRLALTKVRLFNFEG